MIYLTKEKSNNMKSRQWRIQDPGPRAERSWTGNEAWRISQSCKVGEMALRTNSYIASLCLVHMVCSSRKCHLLCPSYELRLVDCNAAEAQPHPHRQLPARCVSQSFSGAVVFQDEESSAHNGGLANPRGNAPQLQLQPPPARHDITPRGAHGSYV